VRICGYFSSKGSASKVCNTGVEPSGASLRTAPRTDVPHFGYQPFLIPFLSAVIRCVPVGVETGQLGGAVALKVLDKTITN
jgi:hypothetical protein